MKSRHFKETYLQDDQQQKNKRQFKPIKTNGIKPPVILLKDNLTEADMQHL